MKFKYILLLILIFFSVFFLTGCTKNKNDNIEKKLDAEIDYLDNKLVEIINTLQNLNLYNYQIELKEIQDKENSEESGSDQYKQSSMVNTDNDLSGNNQKKESNVEIYSINQGSVINRKNDIDWKNLKINIEQIYTIYSGIILDLYKVNVSSEEILGFNKTLDKCLVDIKNENKSNSLYNIAELYAYLPKYISAYSNNKDKINLIYTKAYIIKAYSNVEENKWDMVSENLSKSEEYYMYIVNNLDNNKNNINKTYILLKELQNSTEKKDKDIFYIKYINLMDNIKLF